MCRGVRMDVAEALFMNYLKNDLGCEISGSHGGEYEV
jgi:hypothetical protein